MRESTIAHSYATALYDLAERHSEAQAFADAFDELTALLDSQPVVHAFLRTPKISANAKKEVLRKTLAERVPKLFLNFVMVSVDKRRQGLLGEIGREYQAL